MRMRSSTTASFSAAGTYVLRLTAIERRSLTSDDVTITVNPAGNQAPVVNAGADRDDHAAEHLASGRHGQRRWAAESAGSGDNDLVDAVSGPGTVTFGNANALSTTASFSTAGTYMLRLTASDSVARRSTTSSSRSVSARQPAARRLRRRRSDDHAAGHAQLDRHSRRRWATESSRHGDDDLVDAQRARHGDLRQCECADYHGRLQHRGQLHAPAHGIGQRALEDR